MKNYELLINELGAKIHEARAYLNSTDYQRLRELDGGEPMSAEVKAKRIEYRALINDYQEEIEALRAEWEEAIEEEEMHPSDDYFNVE